MLKVVFDNPWVQAGALVVALALVCGVVYLLSPVLVSLLLAFLVAYFLNPVVDFFAARGVRRTITISALAILGILLLLSIPFLLVPRIISEADQLVVSATTGTPEEATQGRVYGWTHRVVMSLPLDSFVTQMGWGEPQGRDEALHIIAAGIGEWVKQNAVILLKSNALAFAQAGERAGRSVAQLLSSFGHGVIEAVIFLANLALFAFVAGYLLRDFHGLVAAGKELLPPRYRETTSDIVSKIDAQVHRFVRGQMTVCMGLGAMYAVGLLIAGTPFAILIALFGAVVSFVPYLGFIMTIGPTLVLTLMRHGVDWHIFAAMATFVVVPTIEGSFMTPRIVGKRVGLGEVWVILAILVFGSALGFLGILLAVPIAAGLKVLVVEALEYYKRSSMFAGGEPEGAGPAGTTPARGAEAAEDFPNARR